MNADSVMSIGIFLLKRKNAILIIKLRLHLSLKVVLTYT